MISVTNMEDPSNNPLESLMSDCMEVCQSEKFITPTSRATKILETDRKANLKEFPSVTKKEYMEKQSMNKIDGWEYFLYRASNSS
jgi:ketopantoate reductase